jgi:hypothetical protein
MKTIIFISLVFFILKPSYSAEVNAIPLSIYKQDYTITHPTGLYIYGKVDFIEYYVDTITEEKSVTDIRMIDGNFTTHLYTHGFAVEYAEEVKNKLLLLKKGQVIAFSVRKGCNIYSVCILEGLYFKFNKIKRDLPKQKRPKSITVDEYFSQKLMYGPIPIKIKGIVKNKESNLIVIAGNNQQEIINCMVERYTDDQLRINKIIHNEVNIGDEVTCAGSFGEMQIWDKGGYPGQFFLVIHDLIIDK